jgi:ATP-dependent protease ClpP protease subunit
MSKEKSWYRIANKADRSAEIHIFEQIGEDFWTGDGMTAKKFLSELKGLDVDAIELHINSPGGSVFDGQAIYSMLKNHKARVDVHIDGLAASIASVIAMAGDTVTIPRNALMMIHDPSGFAMGTAEDMRKVATALDKVKTGIIAAYQDKTGMAEDALAELMSAETWMTGDEAVAMGFADATGPAVQMQASAGFGLLERFHNLPRGLFNGTSPAPHKHAAKGDNSMAENKTDAPVITLDLIRAEHPAIVQAIAAEAADKARKEGADAERLRIKAVHEQRLPGHEALIDSMMWDGATSGPEAAVKVLASEKAQRGTRLADMTADGALNVPPAAPAAPAPAPTGTVEERCKAAWDKDASLASEFSDLTAFVAYTRAIEDGHAKILNK